MILTLSISLNQNNEKEVIPYLDNNKKNFSFSFLNSFEDSEIFNSVRNKLIEYGYAVD